MCQKEGCGGDHPTGLHGGFKLKSKDTSKSEHERSDGKSDSKVENKRVDNGCTNLDDLSCNLSDCNGNFMSMSIVPLVLFHKDRPERKIKVYGMLYNCGQGTFIRNDVLEFLDTSVVQTTITVRTMLGSSTEESCAIEGLKVRSINGTAIVDLPRAYSQQSLPVDQNEIPTKECLKHWPHLYEIADEIPKFYADVPIGLLIGVNCPTALRPINVVKEANNGPFAQKTVLGWCIIGPMSKYNLSSKVVRCNRIAVVNKAEGHVASHHFIVENSVKATDCKQMLLDMYDQEFSEPSPKQMRKKMQPVNANGYISSSKDIALSKEDNKFLGKMEKVVTKLDGHYQLPLPFRHENVKMPDNCHQAVQRAMSMRKCFKDL